MELQATEEYKKKVQPALFHCTRTSRIYAGEDFASSFSGADNIIKISPGLAWMRINRFKGLVAALKNETSIDLGLPDSIYPRIDGQGLPGVRR